MGLFKYEQLNISVAFMEKYILDRQLDEYTASVYENKFKEKGVNFIQVHQYKKSYWMTVKMLKVLHFQMEKF